MTAPIMRSLTAGGLFLAGFSVATAEPLLTARAVYDISGTDDESGLGVTINGTMETALARECDTYLSTFDLEATLEGPGAPPIPLIVKSTHAEDETSLTFELFAATGGITFEKTEGVARKTADGLSVTLSVPKDETFTLPGQSLFPMEMVEASIDAAKSGETFVTFASFDGSGNGRDVFDVSLVIGDSGDTTESEDEALFAAGLGFADMQRWPMTYSYFAPEGQDSMAPEFSSQAIVYANGFAQAALHDLGPIAMRMTLVEISPIPSKPCP